VAPVAVTVTTQRVMVGPTSNSVPGCVFVFKNIHFPAKAFVAHVEAVAAKDWFDDKKIVTKIIIKCISIFNVAS
jgi:hypothetical protein